MRDKAKEPGTGKRGELPSEFNFDLLVLILVLIFVNCPSVVKGQTDTKKTTNSCLNFNTRLDFEYDDNVFLFTDDDESDYDDDHPGDVASGRYKNIKSKSDYIIAPRFGINFKTDSVFDETFSAKTWMKYHFHHYNEKKDYTEGRIEFIQSVGKNARVSFEGNFEIDFYKENDLSGAVDLNRNGNITRSERIYSASIYDEYGGILAYRYRIRKGDKDNANWLMAMAVSIEPFMGLRYRRYDSPFENRDRDGALGGLAFDFGFGRKIDIDLTYSYEKISSPDNEELLLVDETENGFNRDINGDGKLKNHAPVFMDIDRSRDRQIFEIEFEIDLTKKICGTADYRLRKDSFTTNDLIDAKRYHQDETRHRIRTGIRWDFKKDWTTMLRYTHTHDNSFDGIFKQNIIMISLRYDF